MAIQTPAINAFKTMGTEVAQQGVTSGAIKPSEISRGRANDRAGGLPGPATNGPSFGETLQRLQGQQPVVKPAATGDQAGLIFSKHAVDRVRSRGIPMGPESMERLNTALQKAQAKGSKDTLVLMDDSAFIMSVKNKTVVTAMDRTMMKENLFTNIDSTIIV